MSLCIVRLFFFRKYAKTLRNGKLLNHQTKIPLNYITTNQMTVVLVHGTGTIEYPVSSIFWLFSIIRICTYAILDMNILNYFM